MNRPSADLLAEVFPSVPLTHDIGEFDTLLAIDRARQILNFTPSRLLARSRLSRSRGPAPA